MLLKRRDIVVQIEHALHRDLDLIIRQMRERPPQKAGRVFLYKEDVVRRGPQLNVYPIRFD